MGTAVPDDEYDSFRRNLSNYEKGLYFELGRAHERGETAERGWVRQFKIETPKGSRVLDNAKTEGKGTRSVERKSGRLNERETHRQLGKERSALEIGQLTQSNWETVEGEKVPRTVQQEILSMARDFRGRFQHEVISRDDALRAMKLGQSLAAKQLELVRAYELDRADRARKRLANIREIVRQREATAKEERERAERERKVREERARVQREAADRVAREFADKYRALLSRDREPNEGNSARAREEAAAAEKLKQRERDDADEKTRQKQREAADRLAEHAQRAREAAANRQPGDMVREVADIMQVSRPTAGIESPHREPPHAGHTRGHREERGRERDGRERTRD
ncbi:hypothetical protein [Nocardia wallacei]|uniref:hypothetical protein n=1 Tax=Nocardia wallacei TaxID=480035 RepID=UPI002457FE59|nr:hypothetical protein [Nocardia wallacei]